MRRAHFNLLHSLSGMALLLIAEGVLLHYLRGSSWAHLAWPLILAVAIAGGAGCIVFATEVIREVRQAVHMLMLLSAIVCEFIVFFAFQYGFLLAALPGSFPGLGMDPVSLLLSSTMVFVFNPIYPATMLASRALMLVNTLESLVLVLFILQNVSQFRARREAAEL